MSVCAIEKNPNDRNVVVNRIKRRMLEWNNPVEFVNNMYGSHPDENGGEYFQSVFSNLV